MVPRLCRRWSLECQAWCSESALSGPLTLSRHGCLHCPHRSRVQPEQLCGVRLYPRGVEGRRPELSGYRVHTSLGCATGSALPTGGARAPPSALRLRAGAFPSRSG